MANMFSGNERKRIPKNLRECYQVDNVSADLWSWCVWIEKAGKILFWIIVASGLVMALSTSIIMDEYGDFEKFEIGLFTESIFGTIIAAIIEYAAYHVLALLIGALATIVQHTKITADITLYKTAKEEGYVEEEETEIVVPTEEKTFVSKEAETKKTEQQEKTQEEPKMPFTCGLCYKGCEKVTYAKIVNEVGTRYRDLCDDCMEKHNATPVKKK